ncbi:glycosyltransferase family protein [Alkalihalobacillus sp. AL-G]|uniref:glycosyltransferase family protein n=1 Tax=Alkalihalobacillus sp. AL-G TaxID=2926399 RepID=UPI0027297A02|nr:glycosyltransferase family protein [Alkalihalobacillus sp. AL-G]WLD93088.1 glycosyltransferase family protein [Alkalihalobacillus sp. AL-G]
MKVVAIIQARMGSTRLPGKILKEVLGKSLLEYQIERIRLSEYIDEIMIATTTNAHEQPIIDLCNRLSLPFYRGSEHDVLARYYQAAKEASADVVVRLTSDCPLLDPKVVDQVIEEFLNESNGYDYVSNTLTRTFPRGMDVEALSMFCLEYTHDHTGKDAHREHVTPYIYENPDLFKLGNVKLSSDYSNVRLTVDTPEDFELVEKIIEYSSQHFSGAYVDLRTILDILEKNSEWLEINRHIEQKKV